MPEAKDYPVGFLQAVLDLQSRLDKAA
jgi:hypothetical protein